MIVTARELSDPPERLLKPAEIDRNERVRSASALLPITPLAMLETVVAAAISANAPASAAVMIPVTILSSASFERRSDLAVFPNYLKIQV